MTPEEFNTLNEAEMMLFIKHNPSWVPKNYLALKADLFRKRFIYLITWTKDPKLTVGVSDDEIQAAIERKLTTMAMIKHAYLSKELTQAGVAHWHAAVDSGSAIPGSFSQYFKSKYGFCDVSRNKTHDIRTAKAYITKEGPAKTVK